MTEQLSFFGDAEKPSGFKCIPEFITPAEEEFLLSQLEKADWKEFKMHGMTARRKIVHYGHEYALRAGTLKAGEPYPDYLKSYIARIASLLETTPENIQEVLFSYYPIGAPIGWHRDAPMFESLAGISLKNPCMMKMRKINDNKNIFTQELKRRSLYIIKGESRWLWQHHIPPVKGERYSITFRTLRK